MRPQIATVRTAMRALEAQKAKLANLRSGGESLLVRALTDSNGAARKAGYSPRDEEIRDTERRIREIQKCLMKNQMG